MEKNPIGIFDSGFGGLTVLKEIVALMPQYQYYYLGDNARAPYGPLPYETVYAFTLQAVNWFFSQGCELVILACNTASAKALRTIQQNNLPPSKKVLGIIRPTAEVIGNYSKTGHVGVLGTVGTVQSESYVIEINKFFPDVVVHQQACPTWVALVENNQANTPQASKEVKYEIDKLLQNEAGIDAVLLACTHYPLLQHQIQKHVPAHVQLVGQGQIVAKSLQQYLLAHPEIEEHCSKKESISFFTTGSAESFDAHAATFFGHQVASKTIVL